MALALSGNLSLGSYGPPDAWLPRLLWRNHFADGTVTASSAHVNHPAEMAADIFTDTAWIGAEGDGTWWLRVSKDGASADYCALAGWDLSGLTITLQSSADGDVWDDVAAPIMTADRVAAFLFEDETHDHWRILFVGDHPPQIANAALGLSTILIEGLPLGFEPPRQARDNDVMNNETRQGHLAGRSVRRLGISTTLRIDNLDEHWVRNEWEPFMDHAETRPFYVVWSPAKWPNEVAFVWTHGKIRAPRYSTHTLMSTQIEIKGFAR